MDILEKLKLKSNLLASIHSSLRDRYNNWYMSLTFITLLVSSLLISLTFISDEFLKNIIDLSSFQLKLIIGILALLNFYFGLVVLIWNPKEKSTLHKTAVNHYTKITYDINIAQNSDKISDEIIEKLKTDYLNVELLPQISSHDFIKYKKKHKMKVFISKNLDQKPFINILITKIKLLFKQNFIIKDIDLTENDSDKL